MILLFPMGDTRRLLINQLMIEGQAGVLITKCMCSPIIGIHIGTAGAFAAVINEMVIPHFRVSLSQQPEWRHTLINLLQL